MTGFTSGGFAVYGELVLAAPAWHAQVHCELLRFGHGQRKAHGAVPRVICFLFNADLSVFQRDLAVARHIQIHIHAVVILRVDVAGQGRQPAHEVGGAAGAAEPWLAVVGAAAGQRVDVEEVLAVEPDAGEQAVVRHLLDDVGVARVRVEQVEAVVPERHADGGAGFSVGRVVGEVVGDGESLVLGGGPDAARDVHLAKHNVVPDLPIVSTSAWSPVRRATSATPL